MSREVKYRVWDKNSNQMLFGGKDFNEIPVVAGRPLRLKNGGLSINYTLVEYTGLLDKNGVEIYEGDIVTPLLINGSITLGEVKYIDGGFMAKQIGAERLVENLRYCVKLVKVIGNIYENPELLEEE